MKEQECSGSFIVFLMVNPLLWQPFYVGTKRPGSGSYTHASARDLDDLKRVVSAIKSAGAKPIAIKVTDPLDAAKALSAEAHWVLALSRGGIDVINYQAHPDIRSRAIKLNLSACERHVAEKSLKSQYNQLSLDFASQAPAHTPTRPRPPRAEPKVIDQLSSDQLSLRKGYLEGDSIERMATERGLGIRTALTQLIDIARNDPAVYQKLIRDKLISGSLGAYQINPALDRCLGRRGGPKLIISSQSQHGADR